MSINKENIQFLINNVIFPFLLSQQAMDSNNESILLDLVSTIIEKLGNFENVRLSFQEKLKDLKEFFGAWLNLQANVKLNKEEIYETLHKLKNGKVAAIYLAEQNSTIMIHMKDQPIITAFQCSLKSIRCRWKN